jgi:hypothetical protein
MREVCIVAEQLIIIGTTSVTIKLNYATHGSENYKKMSLTIQIPVDFPVCSWADLRGYLMAIANMTLYEYLKYVVRKHFHIPPEHKIDLVIISGKIKYNTGEVKNFSDAREGESEWQRRQKPRIKEYS